MSESSGLRLASPPGAVLDPPAADEIATRTFSLSIVISASRCLLTYVVFPWLLPLLGVANGVGPGLGIVIGTVAIGFNLASIRRFWAARHRWRWPITVLNVSVIALLAVLVVQDVLDVVG